LTLTERSFSLSTPFPLYPHRQDLSKNDKKNPTKLQSLISKGLNYIKKKKNNKKLAVCTE
jgi:hypothetical protein